MIKCPECDAIAHFVGVRHINETPHNRYECGNCGHVFNKTSDQEYEQLLLNFAERENMHEEK